MFRARFQIAGSQSTHDSSRRGGRLALLLPTQADGTNFLNLQLKFSFLIAKEAATHDSKALDNSGV
jgi:hypothetical protein